MNLTVNETTFKNFGVVILIVNLLKFPVELLIIFVYATIVFSLAPSKLYMLVNVS